MIESTPQSEIAKYYLEIKAYLPDNRSNIGKRHELAFVLVSFLVAILRSNGKLSLSQIHRTMNREHCVLSQNLDYKESRCISRVQLRRVLQSLDYKSFNRINEQYFGKVVKTQNRLDWYSIDGKELRGNIDRAAGSKRGENVVLQVNHQSKQSQIIGFYEGKKQSEKQVVKQYFEQDRLFSGQGYSMDALHCSSDLLAKIAKNEGVYLCQVKANQKELLEDCVLIHQKSPNQCQATTIQKAHGRIETRKDFCYPINVEGLQTRWKETQIKTLVVLQRDTLLVKNDKKSTETAYYISNMAASSEEKGLIDSVRNHWTIESQNYVRDVNFGEDNIVCLHQNISRAIASVLTIAINLLQKQNKIANLRILRENLVYDRSQIFKLFQN